MMKQHPLSAAFPPMPAEQFEALKDSITDIGVQDPITVFEGMVLDGWHRYTAANDLGMDCPTVELGDVDPQAFVVAKNKARRHITQSQIAAAVVAVYGWKPLGANQHGGSAPGTDPKSTKQLAEIAGVGARTIERAKTVESKATPEVKAAVKSGAMSVKKAAEMVNPPKAKEAAPEPDLEDHGADFDPLAELEASNDENTRLRKLMEIRGITERIKAGDLSDLEGMLVSQAISLQTMFTSLSRRAKAQGHQRNLEAFMGMAFKAQAQSRSTIQALVELKYPRQVAFVKQTNITSGNQQVNNSVPAPAGNAATGQNKLLEPSNGAWMDTGAQSTPSRADPHLEAVGPGNRATKPGRKSPRVA